MEQLEEKWELIFQKLESIEEKLERVLENTEYTGEHALRDYLLNVGGDVTGDILMQLLTGKQ